MSVSALLQASRELEQSLQEQLAEARSFKLQLETLDQDYDWVALPFERITIGMIGIVKSQNWLFQVTNIFEHIPNRGAVLAVEPYEELRALYKDGEGAVWCNPSWFDAIDVDYPESHHYEDEDVWVLRDCLFAVYKGGN